LPETVLVNSDPALLERVVRNLVTNALRHTERGAVLVGCRRRGGVVLIEIWDTGPGIAPDHRDAIFREFYQVDRPGTLELDQERGLGLGLPIVARLCALLGHDLSLGSRLGCGSVFRVRVPLADEA
ncbi:MAG: ATP-binding protein, partial [Rhodospirillales bacterium]|nr:ATP-binding protein [Rhodospirillales bacterium]